MSTVNRNSSLIADAVASPVVFRSPATGGRGSLQETVGLVTPAADDSATSIHRFVRVPSNARISRVGLTCAIASTAGAVDIGVYQTSENGGAVVDADLFASGQSLSAVALVDENLTFESGQYTLAEAITPLWQVLGLTSDPKIYYDIATTITTTFNGGPTAMLMRVNYVY